MQDGNTIIAAAASWYTQWGPVDEQESKHAAILQLLIENKAEVATAALKVCREIVVNDTTYARTILQLRA